MRRNTKTMYEWRKAYRDKEELMLERGFPEVSPHEFYRDLFPEGSLQSAEHDGKGNLIATQIRPSGKGRTKQWVVDDSLNMLDKVIGDEFGLIPPITFYGKTHTKQNAHELYAVAIDIDYVGKQQAEKSAIGELPKSKLSKAFHYALNNREGFWNYLEDGNCSISNSLAENCIRPFVIGRKNWLFSGSPKGAEASAGIYTLVETAKANGLAPMKYIKYILSDMPGSAFLEHPEYLDDYLPWNPLVKEFCR